MSIAKGVIIHLIFGYIKKILLFERRYFPEPYTLFKNEIKIEVDLSSYATKSDIKNGTGVASSKFVKKPDLASLKLDIHQLDIEEVETLQVDLSKLGNVVKNEGVKKTVNDELVKKLNAIDTSGLVKKTGVLYLCSW